MEGIKIRVKTLKFSSIRLRQNKDSPLFVKAISVFVDCTRWAVRVLFEWNWFFVRMMLAFVRMLERQNAKFLKLILLSICGYEFITEKRIISF
jgi:hypothetical protein